MFVSHWSKKLKALPVIPPFQGCFRIRQVELGRFFAHGSPAPNHHGSDTGIGEHLQEQGVGDAAINDVSR